MHQYLQERFLKTDVPLYRYAADQAGVIMKRSKEPDQGKNPHEESALDIYTTSFDVLNYRVLDHDSIQNILVGGPN